MLDLNSEMKRLSSVANPFASMITSGVEGMNRALLSTPAQDWLNQTLTPGGKAKPLSELIIAPTYNLTGVFSTNEMEKLLDQKNKEMIKELERINYPG